MKDLIGFSVRALRGLWLLSFVAAELFAQSTVGSVRGQVTDPSGAFVPGATVAAVPAQGQPRAVKTNGQGQFVINGLAPGTYTLVVGSKGFTRSETAGVEVAAAAAKTVDVQLSVSVDKQEVTVEDTSTGQVSTDPSSNAGALVLKGADLDALADNPDDLQDDLQALAGPAAGPNGGQIFIDGFTGGRLPPKESIREIRINQNPFSSEYDKLGYGRIEILTKPGTDKFRGQMFFNFADAVFNSRNPFAPDKPPYQQKYFGGNLSGPLGKKASFFIDVERRNQDEVAVVNAVTLNPSLAVTPFSESVLAPVKRTTFSPRLDYQLNANNTLVGRYTYAKIDQDNQGVGTFSLASRGFNTANTQQTLQVTETSILNAKTINETRFQYNRMRLDQVGDNTTPGIQVLDSFTGGGSAIGLAYNNQDRYELQNYTTITHKTHLFKFGGKLRGSKEADSTTTNYNGLYTFSTIEAYQLAEKALAAGAASVPGATQFSLTKGTSLADVGQVDVGLFAQDDWRLRPNFTLSLGLRYETQNNIHDHSDIAPRVGFAWAVGGSNARTRQPKMVIRGGFGIFYDRFTEDLTLNALHLNGIAQQQYLVQSPNFYPLIPTQDQLAGFQTSQTIRQVDSHLHAPSITQAAIGVERQLPKNTTLAVTFTNSRGLHVLRSRNINAPMPGTGIQPYGDVGNIYQYESSGIFNQHQLMTNVNSRVNSKFSLFGFYVLNYAKSNADGVQSFPSNQYDESTEYGRAQFDVRHRSFVGGSMTLPWGVRMSPFVGASSGVPYNITIGRDLNGDSLFTDRPAFATDLTRASVVTTPYGIFDTNPMPGQTIIPRNFGSGPMQFSVNMRLAKTFGFGATKERAGAAAAAGPDGGGGPGRMPPGGGGGGGGGMRGGGGGGGGMRGGGGGGGMGGIFGDATTAKRYNLTFSMSARNLLNRTNLAPPIGTLSSPLFGQSNAIASGFFGAATANRRLELQMRFTF